MKATLSTLKSMFKAIPELEAAVREDLKHKRYKDAIVSLKELLKREPRRDWEEALADAYLQRAGQVAGKGMYQEAVLLWENHAKFHPGIVVSETYLDWLARAGQPVKMTQVLGKLPEAATRTAIGQRMIEAVAILALENDSLLGQLPQEHAVVRQQPLVRQAIAAYSTGRDAEAKTCLQQIPSRSPYRNLRALLKALLVQAADPVSARAALDRIEASSLCQGVAQAVRDYVASDITAIGGYFALPPKQQTLIHALNGYGKVQISLLRDIQKAAVAKTSKPLLDTVLRVRAELGEEICRRFCLAILVSYPDGISLFERSFGKLTAFETHRIHALHAEQAGAFRQARRFWSQCLTEIKQRPKGQQESLTQAAIMRHIAVMPGESDMKVNIDLLVGSLDFDPDDKATYLALIDLGEKLDEPKLVQTWLDKLIKRYPLDPEALLMAMRAANRRKVFKKVAGYAKTLLKIDPINSQARRFLLEAHLGHARKQLKIRRIDLVHRELAEIRALDPQQRNPAPLFVEGLAAYLEGQHGLADKFLLKALALAGGGAVAQFQFAMEILVAGLKLSDLSRLVSNLDNHYIADQPELMALVKMIGQYREAGQSSLASALKGLSPMLKKSFKQAVLSQEDYFGLCQNFADAALYDVVAECAKQGLRCSPSTPGLIYFEVLAKCRGDASKLKSRDESQLRFALNAAKRAGNHRVDVLIINFLNKFEESRSFGFPDFGDGDGFPLPRGMPGIPPELAALGPEKLFEFLMSAAEIEGMSRRELIGFLSEGQSSLRFQSMSEAQLQRLAMDKKIEEVFRGLLSSHESGGKGRKR
ncbi:MAG: hypothetical protein WCP34_02435 [Pseudomonadota bacterium]